MACNVAVLPGNLMRVLLTNNTLEARAGTELVILELSVELKNRGFLPVVYSPFHGAVANELRAKGVPVITHLSQLQAKPDVIHGHHHLETMAACLKFPSVPAISFCHGWLPWEEMPPTFSSIRHYVAVGETTRERIITEANIQGKPVTILRTFFNDKLFKKKLVINKRPQRALIYNNAIRPNDQICRPLVAACEARGITLELVGLSAGKTTNEPELLLPKYDVVFATGRSALEAAACGCAVIVCDAEGHAGLMRPLHLAGDRISLLELSARAGKAPTSEAVLRDLDHINAVETNILADKIWEKRSLSAAVDSVMSLYRSVLTRDLNTCNSDLSIMLSEASDYITKLSARLKGR